MKYRIVGVGEVLWDIFPDGPRLGGAPANFTYHAGALGAEATLVSRVGKDRLGSDALNRLSQLGVTTGCVEVDPILPTGTVSVGLDSGGQPRFTIHENVAWDALVGSRSSRQAVGIADAICFGSLAQRSEIARKTIRALVAESPSASLRIFDVNLRQHFYSTETLEASLELANVLKVNETELPRLAELFSLAGDEQTQIRNLACRFGLRTIAYTRGGRGSCLYSDGGWSEHPGFPVKVVDTVGAGDAFTAAMTHGLLAGWDLHRINDMANQVATFVCSQSGAMPELPESIRAEFLGD